MSIKEIDFSPEQAYMDSEVFEALRVKYLDAMRFDIESGRHAKQELLFGSIVQRATEIGVWPNMWAYGGVSITPEVEVLGNETERPHKDIEWIIAGKQNLTDLARACGLIERRSILMRGTPLHLYTDPATNLLVELRNINVLPSDSDTGAYAYSKPLWMHPIMPRPLGLPVRSLYPISTVHWGGAECQRVCPELTYLSKCTSDAEKDLYDAERLRRSGMLDFERMQAIHDDALLADMNIVVPPTLAHFIRRSDKGMVDDKHIERHLAGTVWTPDLH